MICKIDNAGEPQTERGACSLADPAAVQAIADRRRQARKHFGRLGVLQASAVAMAAALGCGELHAQQTLPTIEVGARTVRRIAPVAHTAPIAHVTPSPVVHAPPLVRLTPPPVVRVTPPPIARLAPAPAPVERPPQFLAPGLQLGRGPTGVVGYVAAGTSTATKTNTPILRIPQSITILTKQQLEDRGSQSIAQALTYVPGVTVAQGEGNRDQITIRGQNTTADFFTDGVRDDAEYFRDLYNIQAVEVLKGPSALTFGRGGGGGVVNRVTKKADGETIRAAQISTGSFGRKRVTLDVGQAVSDTVAVRLNALYEQSYGFRNFFELERYGINPTLTWKPSDKSYVTLSYEHFRDRRTNDRGVPSIGGLVFGGAPVMPGYPSPAPRHAFFGGGNPSVSDVNYSKVDLNRAALTIDHTTDFGLNIHNQTVYADYQKRYQNTFPDRALGLATVLLNPVAPPTTTPLSDVRLDGYVNSNPRQNIINQTDLTYRFEMTPEIRHTLLAGAEVGHQSSSSDRNLSRWNNPFTGPRQITTPFWFPTVYNPVFFTNPNFRRHTDLDLASGYVQDQIEITKYVDVIAGVRFDSFDLKFRGVESSDFIFRELRRVDNKWSPRFGLVVKPFEQLSLYGSYSRSFLPAAGDQFNLITPSVANLAPQGFENFEAGFKAQILPNLLFTGALYQLNRSNQALATTATTATLADTQTKGGEIGLVGYVTDQWQVSLGYGHQSAHVVKSDPIATTRTPFATNVGKINPSVPRDTFSFWNKYDVSSCLGAGPGVLGVGAGVVYSSKFFPALDNFVVVPGYARVDGAVFLKLTDNISGQVNIENVLGAHYFASAHNNNNISPGAPRSAFVTVNAKF